MRYGWTGGSNTCRVLPPAEMGRSSARRSLAPCDNGSRRGNWRARLPRAPVAQRIEHWFPKPCAQVRFLAGVPNNLNLAGASIRPTRLDIMSECSRECDHLIRQTGQKPVQRGQHRSLRRGSHCPPGSRQLRLTSQLLVQMVPSRLAIRRSRQEVAWFSAARPSPWLDRQAAGLIARAQSSCARSTSAIATAPCDGSMVDEQNRHAVVVLLTSTTLLNIPNPWLSSVASSTARRLLGRALRSENWGPISHIRRAHSGLLQRSPWSQLSAIAKSTWSRNCAALTQRSRRLGIAAQPRSMNIPAAIRLVTTCTTTSCLSKSLGLTLTCAPLSEGSAAASRLGHGS